MSYIQLREFLVYNQITSVANVVWNEIKSK